MAREEAITFLENEKRKKDEEAEKREEDHTGDPTVDPNVELPFGVSLSSLHQSDDWRVDEGQGCAINEGLGSDSGQSEGYDTGSDEDDSFASEEDDNNEETAVRGDTTEEKVLLPFGLTLPPPNSGS